MTESSTVEVILRHQAYTPDRESSQPVANTPDSEFVIVDEALDVIIGSKISSEEDEIQFGTIEVITQSRFKQIDDNFVVHWSHLLADSIQTVLDIIPCKMCPVDKVSQFLFDNSQIVQVIEEAREVIPSYFSEEESIYFRYVEDPDEEDILLALVIETSLDGYEANERLNSLEEDWLLEKHGTVIDDFLIDVRFR